MRWRLLIALLSLSFAVTQETILIDQLLDGTAGEVRTKGELQALLSRPGELQLLVPELTPWAVYLAQLHRDFGPSTILIGQDTADALCQAGSVMGANLTQVLPSEGISRALGLLLPPDDELQGVVLEGSGLYREMALIDLPDPLEARFNLVGEREAWANVRGSIIGGSLTAEVFFPKRTWVLEPPIERRGEQYFAHPWNGRLQLNLGRGEETLRLSSYLATIRYHNAQRNLLTEEGEVVGYGVLYSDVTQQFLSYGDPPARGEQCIYFGGNPFQVANSGNWSFVVAGRRYYTRNCQNYRVSEAIILQADRITCDVYDEAGRLVAPRLPDRATTHSCTDSMLRGGDCRGIVIKGSNFNTCNAENGRRSWHRLQVALPQPRYSEQKRGERVEIYSGRLTPITIDEPQGTFPIEIGGWVTVNGERFYIPELAAFGIPQEHTISYRTDTYLGGQLGTVMSLGAGGTIGGFFGGMGVELPLAPLPLSRYCQERFSLTPIDSPPPTPVFNDPPQATPPVTVAPPEFDFEEGEGEELGIIEPDPWEPSDELPLWASCLDPDNPPSWANDPEFAELLPWIPECDNPDWQPPCFDLLNPPAWVGDGFDINWAQVEFCPVCQRPDGTIVSESGAANTLPIAPPGGIPECPAPDFSFSLSPNPLMVQAGDRATLQLVTEADSGFSAVLPLRLAPEGLQLSPSQLSVSEGRTTYSAELRAPATTQPGLYETVVQLGDKQQPLTVIVSARADFSFNLTPNAVSLKPGESVNLTLATQVEGGFDATLPLALEGVAGLTLAPNQLRVHQARSYNLTLSAAASAQPGSYQATVRLGDKAQPLTVTILAPDFNFSLSHQAITVRPGQSVTLRLTTQADSGFDAVLPLQLEGASWGALTPNSLRVREGSAISDITLQVSFTAQAGNYQTAVRLGNKQQPLRITVEGQGGITPPPWHGIDPPECTPGNPCEQ